MPREKFDIDSLIKHWFTHHPWLKLISLVLAIIVWFYAKGELIRQGR